MSIKHRTKPGGGGWGGFVGGRLRLSCSEIRKTVCMRVGGSCAPAKIVTPTSTLKTSPRVPPLVGPTHPLRTLSGGIEITEPPRASRAQTRPKHECAAGRTQRRAQRWTEQGRLTAAARLSVRVRTLSSFPQTAAAAALLDAPPPLPCPLEWDAKATREL